MDWVKAGVLFEKQDDITAVKQLALLCPQRHLPLVVDRSTQCAIIVTFLERELYTLYQSLTSSKKKNLILRDLISSPEFSHHLHPTLLKVLKTLFLPSGINIRNLVWHGFITSEEIPDTYLNLLTILIQDTFHKPDIFVPTGTGVHLNAFNSHPNLPLETKTILPNLTFLCVSESFSNTIHLLQTTKFIPDTHKNQAIAAFHHLQDGNSLLFLFSALPTLEHSLRTLFAKVNNIPDISIAHQDKYFSTLDGFGQRNLHQVLLDRVVLATGEPNRLLEVLGDGVVSVLLDLFMMERGFGVRGKLCHGETFMDTILEEKKGGEVDVMTALVCWVFIMLCHKFNGRDEEPSDVILKGVKVIEEYQLSFHPISFLRKSLLDASTSLKDLEALQQDIQTEVNPLISDDTQLKVTIQAKATSTTVEYIDKSARILPSDNDLTSIPNLISTLNHLVSQHHSTLVKHVIDTLSPPTSLFVNLSSVAPYLQFQSHDTLPYGTCLLSIMETILKAMKYMQETLDLLLQKVADRTARSNHRRSLFVHISILPVFVKLVEYVTLWVEHGATRRLKVQSRVNVLQQYKLCRSPNYLKS
ncbi:hypothetical protein BCR33DRAFT_762404 [Rhizoclosmatium globosum]|uniref:DUF4209 domain-containing protein n=1 Tax=Rhizoclosmatium globosum TaxID=329046 RepID=A0A1Y2CVE1_9FUNG|nr:hypothetical protein BCR33DRAFT_762404 [Rhizoclosmatium globosum]|eukprot:ORY50784.1 hypothetical protein BCR33DRAFT_762404 [Rhizoclosmatium globosum]